MRCKFDFDLHIHSKLSLCSGDERQTPERILQYAMDNSLKTVCVTDHFWDENVGGASDWYREQNFEHISASKPLPKADGIDFLFGCETELDKNMTLAIEKKSFDKFDFVVIPTTHWNAKGLTITDDIVTSTQKAEYWFKRLDAVLDMDLLFYKIGIAHLVCGLIDPSREKLLEIISILDRDRLYAIFKNAAEKGVGIELNSDDMSYSKDEKDIILKPFIIAKEAGCKFYFGSDAHHPETLDAAKGIFEKAIDDLGLDETDKFEIIKP